MLTTLMVSAEGDADLVGGVMSARPRAALARRRLRGSKRRAWRREQALLRSNTRPAPAQLPAAPPFFPFLSSSPRVAGSGGLMGGGAGTARGCRGLPLRDDDAARSGEAAARQLRRERAARLTGPVG
eukprot:1823985-Rhodomonas_salina.2